MNTEILFFTTPFTQLNTPYPATAYLKGFLNRQGIPSVQVDLGLEVILRLFSSAGLQQLFSGIDRRSKMSENSRRIVALQNEYIRTIDSAISFLQGKDQSLAHRISDRVFLPEASRFDQLDDLEWAFGTMGNRDQARHLITLYLEDLCDLIRETVDPYFGFSRYAEQLGRSASSFDELQAVLARPLSYIDELTIGVLEEQMRRYSPKIVAFSIPFPGNLYSTLRCAAWVKRTYPDLSVVAGGGFVSTELRSISDVRFFDYIDYLVFDDGEAPLLRLCHYLNGRIGKGELFQLAFRENGQVVRKETTKKPFPDLSDWAFPDYSGLPLDRYLSVVEMVNPMHRLWSDGRWNKLTLAHGCYWGKCSFCDGTLPYIRDYKPLKAADIADRMEFLIRQTGERGFHFVDEAAPPALLRELALEILRRKLSVEWWTNIRFEKSFTPDLCYLLRASGCIAVSGGLEVASDRLLKLINKGVTVSQVARVTEAFTSSGIMVHAYLMYGFPTETAQETIDSLEIVRQFFDNGLLQSAFWHRFALTAHSPVGRDPDRFRIRKIEESFAGFARNDLDFIDLEGCDSALYTEGLNRSLYNYMHGVGFDIPLQKWFEIPVPRTQIPPHYVERILGTDSRPIEKNRRLVWVGALPQVEEIVRQKKNKRQFLSEWHFHLLLDSHRFTVPLNWGRWFFDLLPELMPSGKNTYTYARFEQEYREAGFGLLEEGLATTPMWHFMRKNGLLLL